MTRDTRVPMMLALSWLVMLGCGAPPATTAEPEADEEEAGAHAEVELSPAAVQAAGIVVGQVQRAQLTGATVIPAEIQLDATRTAHVAPLVSGRLADVRASLGTPVHRGDILALMTSADASDLAAASAEARARLSVAQAATERLSTLGETGVTSQRALLEAQAERDRAQAEVSGLSRRGSVFGARGGQTIALVAPLDGIVVAAHAVVGETVDTSEVIFTVADTHHVWAIGRAPERVIADLRNGQAATLRLQAYPRDSFPGTISLLSPMLDESTRTLDVRVELDDTSGRLRAGLFGSLALGTSDDAVLTVPDGALARIEGSDVVFVPGDAAGHFRAVPVVVGHRSMGLCEIERGLADGDAVVTTGAFTLKSELLVAEMEED